MGTSIFKKLTLLVIIYSFIFISCNLNAQINAKRIIHPLMGSISLSFVSGVTIPYTDYDNSNIGFIWKGSASYYFNTYSNHFVAIKIFGGKGTLKGKDKNKDNIEFNTPISFFGTGINYGYRISEKFFPSLFTGLSYLHFNPEDKSGSDLPSNKSGAYSNNDISLNFELGFQYLLTDQITLDLNAGITLNFNDHLDDLKSGNENDMFFTFMFGINYLLTSDKDDDNDGVENSKDICPDTKNNVKVDEFGCPLDSDHDKIPDYLDKCPQTPARVKVNSLGCPIDTDLDGVPDFMDKCANTPQGIEVNYLGCPFDSDYDGIPDYLDECTNTPPGVTVNKSGCPIDSDGDLVPDYLDKCPDTPYDSKVTSDGCLDEFYEYIFDAATLFKTREAILTPNAYKELEQVTEKIKLRPDAKWRIEGYTDSFGSYEYNKKLSLLRAEAVCNFFVSRGIPDDKFEIIGRGEDFPIGDNKTESGRRVNRRVVLIRVDN